MLATEEPVTPDDDPQAPSETHSDTPSTAQESLQEAWSGNERMRHIPGISWMIAKLDGDLRHRIEKLFAVYLALPGSDPRHAPLEHEFRALCRAIDRVADVARRPRGNNHPPADLGHRVSWTVSHAVTNLKEADVDTFGRRFPVQTFERSNAEPLWAAMLNVIDHVHRLTPRVREIDPGIDEQLYEGLVVLNEPLRREPMA
jgi:hypothetical protein